MAQKNYKKTLLIILDGWGVAPPSVANAIETANTPFYDSLLSEYYATVLQASGLSVGLPIREKGNSEVGHLNIGSGRIVYQYLTLITQEVRNGLFFQNKQFLQAIQHAKNNNSNLHIIGLFSTGNVHGSMEHTLGLLRCAQEHNFQNIIVHPFLDGKDGERTESLQTINTLIQNLQPFKYKLPATVMGRMYALDRNNNWHLTQKTYECLTGRTAENTAQDPLEYIATQHKNGHTDYDIDPVNIAGIPHIQDNDSIICTDFREDSVRQLTRAFVLPSSTMQNFQKTDLKNIYFVAMTQYEKDIPLNVAYPPPFIQRPLAQVISEHGLKQIHISESEKYAHITYFFNGQKEKPFPNEYRVLVPSHKNSHYDSKPKMQTPATVQKMLEQMNQYDFYLINIANADMVGHTGNFQATIQGVQTIDVALQHLVQNALKHNITTFITADHGNAEEMLDLKTGEIITHHSANPVPFLVIAPEFKVQKPKKQFLHNLNTNYILADVAPTILRIMGIEQPPEMSGSPIIS